MRLALLVAPFVLVTGAGIPICPSALLLRLPCPGCGLTRAAWALLAGDVATAQRLNPLAVVACPLVALVLGVAAVRYVGWRRTDLSAWLTVPLAVVFVALVAVWAARLAGAFGGPLPV